MNKITIKELRKLYKNGLDILNEGRITFMKIDGEWVDGMYENNNDLYIDFGTQEDGGSFVYNDLDDNTIIEYQGILKGK